MVYVDDVGTYTVNTCAVYTQKQTKQNNIYLQIERFDRSNSNSITVLFCFF